MVIKMLATDKEIVELINAHEKKTIKLLNKNFIHLADIKYDTVEVIDNELLIKNKDGEIISTIRGICINTYDKDFNSIIFI